MSWTSLRESAQSSFARRLAGTPPASDGLGEGLGAGVRGMAKPVPRNPIYAALAALGCGVVIGSLIAAPGPSGLFGAALGLLMIAIAVADARAYLIPDRLTLAAFLLGLANAAAIDHANMPENSAMALLRGIGDVKLAAVAGMWLDWALIPAAIEIAALTALFAYLASQLVLRQPLRAAAKLPFGLFFAPAIWIGWLLGALFLQS